MCIVWLLVKNLAANEVDVVDPGQEYSLRRKWNPFHSFTWEPMTEESGGLSPWGCKGADTLT